MSTLSRALESSNLFVNSLGSFPKPGGYSEPACCSEEDVWQETLRRELRGLSREEHPPSDACILGTTVPTGYPRLALRHSWIRHYQRVPKETLT